jgi:hypothetical protein
MCHKESPNYSAHVDLRGGSCVSWKRQTVVVDPLGGVITHAAGDWRPNKLGNNSICILPIVYSLKDAKTQKHR